MSQVRQRVKTSIHTQMVTIECGKMAERKIVAIIGGLVLISLVGGSICIYSGFYNVAATIPHSSLMEWVLSTISDRSVIHQAEGISPPAYLNDPEIIKAGFTSNTKMIV